MMPSKVETLPMIAVRRLHPRVSRLLVFALGLLLAGCQSLADVYPGDGRTLTITGRDYDAIWQAALRVADEHFEIHEQDKGRGVILAERRSRDYGWPVENAAWVGIFITPPGAGAAAYRVEVVRRKRVKSYLNVQDWETKVLRDLQDVLDGRPMR